MAKALYILPILFAYTNILTGSLLEALTVAIPGCLGIFAMTIAWEGFFLRRTLLFERLLMVVAVFACWYPNPLSYLVGCGLFVSVVITQKLVHRQDGAVAGA